MKKPNFFIIGAPKCGTTSLATWLADHPQIYMSPIKEPHFFNTDGLRSVTATESYEALFAKANSAHRAVGEASTHYLFSREAVPQILQYSPDARFVVCVRNPVEMAPALHAERVWQGRENISNFEEAWKRQEERRLGKSIPATVRKDPERLQYGSYCCLGEQLERLYSNVSRERVLVLVLDDLAAQPKCEYQKVLTFLGVADHDHRDFSVYNRRKIVRSNLLSYLLQCAIEIKKSIGVRKQFSIAQRLKDMNKTASHRRKEKCMSMDLRRELIRYFDDDVHRLERFLGRDLSAWFS